MTVLLAIQFVVGILMAMSAEYREVRAFGFVLAFLSSTYLVMDGLVQE
ncbi:hypothetical protein [Streptomyces sp. NPDC048644]